MKLLIGIWLIGASLLVSAQAAEIQSSGVQIFGAGTAAVIPLGKKTLSRLYGKGVPGVGPIIRIKLRPKIRLWDSSNGRPQPNNLNIRYGLGNTQLNKLSVLAPVSR